MNYDQLLLLSKPSKTNKPELVAFDKCRRSHKRHLYIKTTVPDQGMNFDSLHRKHNLTYVTLIIGMQNRRL